MGSDGLGPDQNITDILLPPGRERTQNLGMTKEKREFCEIGGEGELLVGRLRGLRSFLSDERPSWARIMLKLFDPHAPPAGSEPEIRYIRRSQVEERALGHRGYPAPTSGSCGSLSASSTLGKREATLTYTPFVPPKLAKAPGASKGPARK